MTADQVYKTLCNALDTNNWNYDKHEEDFSVTFSVNGEDIPINFIVYIDEKRQLIRFYSPMPLKFEEKKLLDGAIAACVVNNGMVDGNFDFDFSSGIVVFRIIASYRDSIIGEGLIHYLIACVCTMVEEYNDKFLALSKGILGLDRFIEEVNNR